MTVDVITRRADLAALSHEWDALAIEDARDGFFRTASWCQAWIEHVRPETEPFVVVVRDAGAIIGLAPLCCARYNDLGFRLNGIGWAGREVVSGDFLDFLAKPDRRTDVISATLECLRQARSRWSLLVVSELLDGSPSQKAWEAFAKDAGFSIRRQEERFCPYIALPGGFNEYLETLGSSSRYHIRRRLRDFEKLKVEVNVYSRPEEVVAHLDTLARLHVARWRRDHLPGTIGRRGFVPFLRQVCINPPSGAACRLYVLSHQDAPLASLLMFYFGQSALYYQAGWDPDSPLADQSPGVVLMANSIRDAIQQGLRYYEFLRGDEIYKTRWTKTYRKTRTFLIARSFVGKSYLRIARLKDRVKTLVASPHIEANGPGGPANALPRHDGVSDTTVSKESVALES